MVSFFVVAGNSRLAIRSLIVLKVTVSALVFSTNLQTIIVFASITCTLPPTQHHNFFRNLPPLIIRQTTPNTPYSSKLRQTKPNYNTSHQTTSTLLNYTTLYKTTPNYMYFTKLHHIPPSPPLLHITPHCTTLHQTTANYTYFTKLQHVTPNYTPSPNYTKPHRITPHYTKLFSCFPNFACFKS